MTKHFFLWASLVCAPFFCYSQVNVYSSAAENTQNDLTMSHVIGNVVNLESEDGMLSTGALVQYRVAVVTGTEITDVSLLSVYPNPTKDVLVLTTGEMKGLTMSLTNEEGKLLISSSVRDSATSIDFSQYASGLYHLTLRLGSKIVKTFSIVKN